jgi:hypothetical protein
MPPKVCKLTGSWIVTDRLAEERSQAGRQRQDLDEVLHAVEEGGPPEELEVSFVVLTFFFDLHFVSCTLC